MEIVALALALFCIAAEARPHDESVPAFSHVPYIIGGQQVSINSHPHQVSLQSTYGSHTCGGSIIKANKVLCAAHCTQRSASSYRIRAGSADRTSGGQVLSVSRIVNHPSYCSSCTGFPNDISVITVSGSFRFGSGVSTINLPSSFSDFAGQSCMITGWGRTSSSQYLPRMLQGARIQVLSHSDCRRRLSIVRDSMVCIHNTSNREGACNGDSGGPLQCGNQVVGVASWVTQISGVCNTRNPSVYTRVSSYRSWIQSQ